jgi:hypothetical protein
VARLLQDGNGLTKREQTMAAFLVNAALVAASTFAVVFLMFMSRYVGRKLGLESRESDFLGEQHARKTPTASAVGAGSERHDTPSRSGAAG